MRSRTRSPAFAARRSLLEQDADEAGRELTQLICDETDRIVALVDRMEAFSDHRPIARDSGQYP